MKKEILVVFILSVLALSACAAVNKTPISSSDMSLLKGQWEGAREMVWGKYRSYDNTVLEIYNDAVPLRGKINIAFMQGSDPRVYVFENGIIDSEGNLSVSLEKDVSSFLLSLYREEKKLKLDGYYRHRSNEGRLTLYKK